MIAIVPGVVTAALEVVCVASGVTFVVSIRGTVVMASVDRVLTGNSGVTVCVCVCVCVRERERESKMHSDNNIILTTTNILLYLQVVDYICICRSFCVSSLQIESGVYCAFGDAFDDAFGGEFH